MISMGSRKEQTSDSVIKWLKEHPHLSLSGIERDANIPTTVLQKAVGDRQKLNPEHLPAILKVLKDYSFIK